MEKEKTRILIVDDEKSILLVMKEVLSTPEIKVDMAESFDQAMGLIREGIYQIVITDIGLSGVMGEEGLNILKYIRQEDLEIDVIVITGYGTPDRREKALAGGANYYFEKPVSCSTLQTALKALGVPY
jgi:DNA-binding NtrC family response regulator